MNDQTNEILALQNIIGYYRNKCSELEYQYVLYQAKMEKRIQELERRFNVGTDEAKADEAQG